ncbi:MAG: nucleoside deaminase, partial [Acidobacteria bacterium ACB1]|nr:nucleoside deaminase [Acidobacteria bacterium ACB1]
MDERDEEFLRRAIELARKAERRGEVPIGAVIVSEDGEILAEASNETIERHDPTAHAEILAIRRAGERIENYRLTGVTVYSTIEPCAMCAGALVNARVARLVYGAADERFGAVRSKFELCDSDKLNHRIEITAGGLEA